MSAPYLARDKQQDLGLSLMEMQKRGMNPAVLMRPKVLTDLYGNFPPHPGPQTEFLASRAFELLYGGQAGGGKTMGLLLDAKSQAHYRDYAAVLFRKTYKQLEEMGGLVPRSHEVYPYLGAKYHGGDHRWTFASGGVVEMRHLQHSEDRYNYLGSEFAYLGFDQLEQHAEDDYLYLFSRVRTPNKKIVKKVRNTANPGSEWVMRRWLPWLGTDAELEEAHLPRAKSGELLWFKRVNDEEVLADPDDPEALSRTFIAASIYDNPTLI